MPEVTLITGAVWGIVGAIAMVVVMQVRGGEAPPPFAVFWAEFIGDGDPEAAMPAAMSLHFLYAIVAGAVYAFVTGTVNFGIDPSSPVGGVVWGLIWAIVLLAGGMVFWMNMVLDVDPEKDQMMTFAMAHVAYGLTLGILGGLFPHLL